MMVPNIEAALDYQKKLLANPLFADVGRPIDLSGFPECGNIRFVDTWENADQQASNKKFWLYPGTVVMNACAKEIYMHFGQEWFDQNINEIVDTVESQLPTSTAGLKKLCAKNARAHISENIFKKVKYDLVRISLEIVYGDILKDTYFLSVVEPFYLAGHFPCGWDTKNKKALKSVKDISTKGELIVF